MQLEETVADLAPQLLRYCLARTESPSLAEDIAQEALTALVSRWRPIGPPDSPPAFVFTIAPRRAARAQSRLFLTAPLDALFAQPDQGPTPEEEHTELEERLADVRRAFLRLSSRERNALLLVSAGELRHSEAAAALGISESAVKMRVLRARNHLQEILELRYEST
jgi:RNA polymerase sigma-70 factor (ECF subfamily)